MPTIIDTSTQLIGQIAQRLDKSNVQHRQYLDNLNFAQQIQAHGGQDAASKSQGISAMVKPSSGVFAEIAGISETDAVSILHGVVGSNTDTRDWGVIMASDDPLAAARAATAAMYGTPPGSGVVQTTNPATGEPRLQSGNFAIDRVPVASTVSVYGAGPSVAQETRAALYLVDKEGAVLRHAGDTAAQMSRNAWLFGFDLEQLKPLASSVQASAPQLAAEMGQASNARFTVQGQPLLQVAAGSVGSAAGSGEVTTTGLGQISAGGSGAGADEISRFLQEWLNELRA